MGIEEILCKIYSNDRISVVREILFSLLLVIFGLVSLALVRAFSDSADFEEENEGEIIDNGTNSSSSSGSLHHQGESRRTGLSGRSDDIRTASWRGQEGEHTSFGSHGGSQEVIRNGRNNLGNQEQSAVLHDSDSEPRRTTSSGLGDNRRTASWRGPEEEHTRHQSAGGFQESLTGHPLEDIDHRSQDSEGSISDLDDVIEGEERSFSSHRSTTVTKYRKSPKKRVRESIDSAQQLHFGDNEDEEDNLSIGTESADEDILGVPRISEIVDEDEDEEEENGERKSIRFIQPSP